MDKVEYMIYQLVRLLKDERRCCFREKVQSIDFLPGYRKAALHVLGGVIVVVVVAAIAAVVSTAVVSYGVVENHEE
jgi:hypothetical protein